MTEIISFTVWNCQANWFNISSQDYHKSEYSEFKFSPSVCSELGAIWELLYLICLEYKVRQISAFFSLSRWFLPPLTEYVLQAATIISSFILLKGQVDCSSNFSLIFWSNFPQQPRYKYFVCTLESYKVENLCSSTLFKFHDLQYRHRPM